MDLIWSSAPPQFLHQRSSLSLHSRSLNTLSFPLLQSPNPRGFFPLRATGPEGGRVGSQGAHDPALLRKPLASSPSPLEEDAGEERPAAAEEWVDWEDQILEDTVPLVGFVRMILHSGKYESGDRLSPEHEKTILERLLPNHPECEKKIGCGIDFITIGFHPEFENSKCLFIVRKDGELVDFSYWKCIKGLIKKNYPPYADSFILRHFGKRRQTK